MEPGTGISQEMGKKPKPGEPGDGNRDWIWESSRNMCLQDKIWAHGQKFKQFVVSIETLFRHVVIMGIHGKVTY